MKRFSYLVVAVLLVAALLLVNAPKSVAASDGDIGSGSWVLPITSAPYTSVNVDEAAKTAPTWLQQLSEGIAITKSDKICYPFRGGQFHWVPQILQLADGKWTKIDTTEWIPSPEETPLACAKAPAAGTYALFGYYNGPVEVGEKECDFQFEGQYRDFGDINDDYVNQTFDLLFILHFDSIKLGDPVTYSLYNITPTGSITSHLTGKTTVVTGPWGGNGAVFGTFHYHTTGKILPAFNVYLNFPTQKCYKVIYNDLAY